MPFADSFPVRARGPRSDLCLIYGRFTASSSGTVLTADANTSSGLTITSSGSGVYILNHPKCRFRILTMQVQLPTIATVASKREITQHVGVAGTDTAAEGVLNFNTQNQDATPIVAVLVDDSVVEVFGILGF